MNNERKLTHIGGECILQHMDYNFRYFLTRRCPALLNLEKTIPLKIDHFSVGDSKFCINNITYRMGVTQHYKYEKTPKYIMDRNRGGGLAHNVDKYGLSPESSRMLTEDLLKEWKYELEMHEEEKKEAEKMPGDGMSKKISVARAEGFIQELQAKILPHELKRKDQDPPYDHLLMLRIFNQKYATLKSEKVEYAANLWPALEYIFEKVILTKKLLYIKNMRINGLLDSDYVGKLVSNPEAYKIRLLTVDYRGISSFSLYDILRLKHPKIEIITDGGLNPNFFEYINENWPVKVEQHFTFRNLREEIALSEFAKLGRIPRARIEPILEPQNPLFQQSITLPSQNGMIRALEVKVHFEEKKQKNVAEKRYVVHIETYKV